MNEKSFQLADYRLIAVAAGLLVTPALIGLVAFGRRRGAVAALVALVVALPTADV